MQSQINLFTMKQIAQSLNVGRNKLMNSLRRQNILTPWNTPYDKFVDAGYFKKMNRTKMIGCIETKIPVTMVTPLGKEFIKKLIEKNILSIIK